MHHLAILLLALLLPAPAVASGVCHTAEYWASLAQGDALPPEERHARDLQFSPLYRAQVLEGRSWLSGDAGRETCFEPEDLSLQGVGSDFGPYEGRRESEHFVMQFDPSSTSAATAQWKLDELEAAWAFAVDQQGFSPPPGTDEHQMLVFIDPLPPTIVGLTAYGQCEGEIVPYMILSQQYLADTAQDLAFLASHEFFHALQMTYWLDGMLMNPAWDERWLIESTATYHSTASEPASHAWNAGAYAPHAAGWPDAGLRTLDPAFAVYGRYLYWLAAEQQLGPEHLVLYAEATRERTDHRHQDVVAELLEDTDVAVPDFYAEYLRLLSTGDWGIEELEGVRPGTVQEPWAGGGNSDGVALRYFADDLPLDGWLDAPEELGASFVRLSTLGLEGGLRIRLEVESDHADWVYAASVFSDGELVDSIALTDEAPELWLGDAEQVDFLLLGAFTIEDSGAHWRHRVDAAPVGASVGFSTTAPGIGGDGCACGAAGGGAGLLSLLLLVGRRRRLTPAA